jgi:hypothetical protein
MAATYQTDPTFGIRERRLLFRWPFEDPLQTNTTGVGRQMSVTPDGQRFLFLSVGQDQQTGSADRQLVVIQ